MSDRKSATDRMLGAAESLVEAWAAEVLQICPTEMPHARPAPQVNDCGLDDLFACYKARDRLDAIEDHGFHFSQQAADTLLVSFTEEVGRGWLAAAGLEEFAGQGWWWSRVPVTGPIREEFESATDV